MLSSTERGDEVLFFTGRSHIHTFMKFEIYLQNSSKIILGLLRCNDSESIKIDNYFSCRIYIWLHAITRVHVLAESMMIMSPIMLCIRPESRFNVNRSLRVNVSSPDREFTDSFYRKDRDADFYLQMCMYAEKQIWHLPQRRRLAYNTIVMCVDPHAKLTVNISRSATVVASRYINYGFVQESTHMTIMLYANRRHRGKCDICLSMYVYIYIYRYRQFHLSLRSFSRALRYDILSTFTIKSSR
ncbi:hypothetical protein PUN28_015422 [Cardiocondyla obscurior]|uniref:Uncharacterized protein n=1 Tax=Cardiocondyla obscurior TaxID=286306 RepID=A0AAW2EY00_9HYME